jgi:hypothetical protein
MNVFSSLIIGVLISSLVGAFGGEDANHVKGEVLEFGTYNVLARKADVQAPAGSGKQESPVHIVTAVEFLEHTNCIVSRKGTSFGFRYKLTGLPDEPVVLDFETIHPEFTLPNGSKDSGRVVHGECETKGGVWESTMGYHFDEDFEMVEGDWVMSVYYNKTKLVSQIFHVRTAGNQ